MFAFVPALGALFEDFVVTLFVLLDESFETDVAAGFDAAMIAGEQEQQTRDTTIAIAERMDAEKIEIERRGRRSG